jgi:hypothetical protein
MVPHRITRCLPALLALVLAFALPVGARAQTPAPPPTEGAGLLVGARGVGELWQDPNIIKVYERSSRFSGAGFLSYRVWRFVAVDVEAGFHRMGAIELESDSNIRGSESTSLQLVPMCFGASANHRVGELELFGSLGLAVTSFSDLSRNGAVNGTKFGPSVQAGVRIDTGFADPSIRRDAGTQLRAVDLEIMVGRRQHQAFGVGDGLDLSAWRASVGLLARF